LLIAAGGSSPILQNAFKFNDDVQRGSSVRQTLADGFRLVIDMAGGTAGAVAGGALGSAMGPGPGTALGAAGGFSLGATGTDAFLQNVVGPYVAQVFGGG
jgi:hypothetical protein